MSDRRNPVPWAAREPITASLTRREWGLVRDRLLKFVPEDERTQEELVGLAKTVQDILERKPR